MACEECAGARDNPEWHRLYDPRCLWCGARYVKQLRRLDLPKTHLDAWRSKVLDDWEAFGHDRQRLRELAMGPVIPLEPQHDEREAAGADQRPAVPAGKARKRVRGGRG